MQTLLKAPDPLDEQQQPPPMLLHLIGPLSEPGLVQALDEFREGKLESATVITP